MTNTTVPTGSIRSLWRNVLIGSGAVAAIVGALILIWPTKTAMAVTFLVALYTIAAGIANIAYGLTGSRLSIWGRLGFLLVGVLFIVSAIIAFSNLGFATAALAAGVAIFLGITWIVEGAVAIAYLPYSPHKTYTVISAVVSIIAGFMLAFAPAIGGDFLWVWAGVALVFIGIVQLVRGFNIQR